MFGNQSHRSVVFNSIHGRKLTTLIGIIFAKIALCGLAKRKQRKSRWLNFAICDEMNNKDEPGLCGNTFFPSKYKTSSSFYIHGHFGFPVGNASEIREIRDLQHALLLTRKQKKNTQFIGSVSGGGWAIKPQIIK